MDPLYEKCNYYLDNSNRLIKQTSKNFDKLKSNLNIHNTKYSYPIDGIGACYPSLIAKTIHKMKSPALKEKRPKIASWQEYDFDLSGNIVRLRSCKGENLFNECVYYFVKDGNATYALPFKEDTNEFYPYAYWFLFVLEDDKVEECMMMKENEVHYEIYDYCHFDDQIIYCRYGTYDKKRLSDLNQNYPANKSGSPMKYDLGENKVTIHLEDKKPVRMVDNIFLDGVESPHYEYINGKKIAFKK